MSSSSFSAWSSSALRFSVRMRCCASSVGEPSKKVDTTLRSARERASARDDGRLVDEGAAVLARRHIVLVGEDAQDGEHGVVGDRIARLERFGDFAHARLPLLPQHAHDALLGFGENIGFWLGHGVPLCCFACARDGAGRSQSGSGNAPCCLSIIESTRFLVEAADFDASRRSDGKAQATATRAEVLAVNPSQKTRPFPGPRRARRSPTRNFLCRRAWRCEPRPWNRVCFPRERDNPRTGGRQMMRTEIAAGIALAAMFAMPAHAQLGGGLAADWAGIGGDLGGVAGTASGTLRGAGSIDTSTSTSTLDRAKARAAEKAAKAEAAARAAKATNAGEKVSAAAPDSQISVGGGLAGAGQVAVPGVSAGGSGNASGNAAVDATGAVNTVQARSQAQATAKAQPDRRTSRQPRRKPKRPGRTSARAAAHPPPALRLRTRMALRFRRTAPRTDRPPSNPSNLD